METQTKKIVLITGGASGIGRIMAQKFSLRKYQVIIWDIHHENILAIEKWAQENHVSITGILCDITKREQVYENAKKVLDTFGYIDILINNAGVVSGKTLLETPDEKIELTMKVNTMALFWLTKAFLPKMLERKTGNIVTVASAAGLIGVQGLADYSASKFAAVGFMESLRMELHAKKTGIHTTVICPFFIDTGMFSGVKTKFPWLLPILKPEFVADKAVHAILHNKKRLILPLFVYGLFFLRLLPIFLFDAMVNFFGINHSMDHFTGHTSPK